MKKHLIFFVLLSVSFLFISCGEETTVSLNSGSNVPLKINIVDPGQDQASRTDFTTAQLEDFIEFVESVRVSVSDGFPTFTRTFSASDTILLFVPPGENITFIVALLNSEGQSICSGQVTTDIIPGIQNEITIECEVNDEVCDNGEDDNGNGEVDCEENACAGSECDNTNVNICIDNVCVAPPAEENDCDDGLDNDFDEGMPNGGTDCEDLDCADDPACIETVCDDGVDNDSDGDTDCEDLDCADDSACDEVCDNTEDDDNDGDIDCADDECDNQNCNANDENFVCVEGVCEDTGGETDCDNGVDDDEDGFTDCEDLDDCEGRVCFDGDQGSACVIVSGEGGPEGECQEVICDDEINNDDDLLFGEVEATDCADPDCEGEPCGTGTGAECDFFGEGGECLETNCFDDVDNNLNEDTDCDDFNCYFNNLPCGNGSGGQGAECVDDEVGGRCAENSCANGLDDDGDESTDCFDFDCEGQVCGDGLGGAECIEFFQAIQPKQNQTASVAEDNCVEIDCTNGTDDDLDGYVDCEDGDCFEDTQACPCAFNCSALPDDGCLNMACNGPGQACRPTDGLLCEEFDCDNMISDDGDSNVDCADAGCEGETGPSGEICEPFGEVSCSDGFDNDNDGDIDGADTDCQF